MWCVGVLLFIVILVRLAGDHQYGKLLLSWLSLVVSLVISFWAVFFPWDVLDGIWDWAGSVSKDFPTYSCWKIISQTCKRLKSSLFLFLFIYLFTALVQVFL